MAFLRDPLAEMVTNTAGSKLPGGFWPESPNDSKPRLLASVYALEALGYVLGGRFRIGIDDLLGRKGASEAWTAFRYGLAALHDEADRGGGLLGISFGKPTAYLTGIALYRLAPIAVAHPDLEDLATKLVEGFSSSCGLSGWVDTSSPPKRQDETRNRTSLRAIAGLGRAEDLGIPVSPSLKDRTLSIALDIGKSDYEELDSPDLLALQAF
jgi:hypothetical protein